MYVQVSLICKKKQKTGEEAFTNLNSHPLDLEEKYLCGRVSWTSKSLWDSGLQSTPAKDLTKSE